MRVSTLLRCRSGAAPCHAARCIRPPPSQRFLPEEHEYHQSSVPSDPWSRSGSLAHLLRLDTQHPTKNKHVMRLSTRGVPMNITGAIVGRVATSPDAHRADSILL